MTQASMSSKRALWSGRQGWWQGWRGLMILASCFVIATMVLAQGGTADAAPIQGVSPRTQFFLGTAVRSFYQFTLLERGDRELRVQAVPLIFSYALRPDATLTFSLPYLDKELELPDGRTLRSSGVGDGRVLGKWTFLRRDAPHARAQAAVFGGLELPSGSDSEREDGVLLPPGLQPGSGSVDGLLGAAFGFTTRRFNVEGGLQWQLNSEANDFRFGNELAYDLALQYSLYPSFPTADRSQLNLTLEFNERHTEKDRLGRHELGNSGGDVILVSPGIQYILNSNLLLEASFQTPIYQELNEDSVDGPDPLRFKYSVLFGFRYIF